MLFPDLMLHSRVHQTWETSGMDSVENCNDPAHFRSYPYPLTYQYNSRGFRDQEWPQDFHDVIWCVGDSFTVGIGSPLQHTWPWLLGQRTGLRTINISMDGASNQWICRRACEILRSGLAQRMVIQWSYTHRRENHDVMDIINSRWQRFYQDVRDSNWPPCPQWQYRDQLPIKIQQELERDPYWSKIDFVHDEERRIDIPRREAVLDPTLNTQDFQQCVQQVEQQQNNCELIHTFIPDFSDDPNIQSVLHSWPTTRAWLPPIVRLDWARDHHHYDIVTAQNLVTYLHSIFHW
jgi:hypothetical protein